jgi:hypothetical protein
MTLKPTVLAAFPLPWGFILVVVHVVSIRKAIYFIITLMGFSSCFL